MKKFYSMILFGAVAASASAFEVAPVRVAETSDVLGYAKENRPVRLTTPANNLLKAAPAKTASGTWTDWTSAGTCTFTIDTGLDDFGTMVDYSGSFTGITVDRREDTGDANVYQYRLNGVYNNKELIVDINSTTGAVYVFPQETGFNCYGEMPMTVMDCGTAFREIAKDEDTAAIYDTYNYFIEPLGRLYIYLGYTFEGLGDLCALTDVTVQFDGYPDFTPEISFAQRYADDKEAKGVIKTTESAEYVKVGVLPGVVTQKKINAVMADGERIASGDAEYVLPEMPANVPHTLYAISYVGDVACEMATQYVTRVGAEEGKWKTIGKTTITIDLIESLIGFSLTETEVDVQQDVDNPGRYRLVNPYGNSTFRADDMDQYFTFDLSDPDYVTLEPTNIGLDFGSGSLIAFSGYYYYIEKGKTDEQAREAIAGGKYDAGTRTVSFGDETIILDSDDWTALGGTAGGLYFANGSGKMGFTLPEGTVGVENIAVDADADSRLFNLQGVEVSGNIAPGVYIRTTGAKATKVIVR